MILLNKLHPYISIIVNVGVKFHNFVSKYNSDK